MNIKNTILYTALCGAIAIQGCSKGFTDLNPLSQRNTESFYETPEDFIAATNAIYKSLHAQGTYNESYWALLEQRSDNTDQGSDGTGLGAELTQLENFTEIATNGIVERAYSHTYQGVYRANIVLDRIERVNFDQALKNRLKGEALFLRSLYYYHLAILFGNIPLELHEVPNGNKTQVSATAIYNQIATDLANAETWLAQQYTGSDVGRATKGAAATLLAKVQLLQNKKTEAATTLRRIINEYNYELVESYSDLWGLSNKNNKESIFEVQFKGGGTNTGNRFTNAFSAVLLSSTGTYKNRPTQEFRDAIEAGDKRLPFLLGATELGAFYITKYGTTNQFGENDASYNFVVFRYADVLLSLAEALGETPESYGLINQVRRRAGLVDIDQNSPGTFEDKLLHERRIELAFENHRWPDLLRFNKATEVLTALGKTPRLLYLIPQRELDINGFNQNSN